MFRLADYEMTDAEMAIYEEQAELEPDLCFWFPSDMRQYRNGRFNACEILMSWETSEFAGVQRIRLGIADDQLTRVRWRYRLQKPCLGGPSRLERALKKRQDQLQAVFADEVLRFRLLGWRPLNIDFFDPAKLGAKGFDSTACRAIVVSDDNGT